MKAWTIAEVLREAGRELEGAGVPEARREAGSLLSFVLGKDRTFLISHAEDRVADTALRQFELLVKRRAAGEPLQYITGVQDFFGREFRVTPDVLIPRPETELLVEAALELQSSEPGYFCDVGTGSGCIAVTLLCELKNARAVALDKSGPALEVAKQNAAAHGVAGRVSFELSDCFDGIDPAAHQFDLVVSNPPYVAQAVVAGLQREVRDHEPLLALSPGPDGLTLIRRLLFESPQFLKQNGHLLMEIGYDQAEAVKSLVDSAVWSLREIRPDLQGFPRIVILKRE